MTTNLCQEDFARGAISSGESVRGELTRGEMEPAAPQGAILPQLPETS
jgi:hypothetical protein